MKTIILFATAAIAPITASASAASASNPATTRPEAVEVASPAAAGADNRRYCVKETPTGTRIERKTCRTRAGWAAEGVDIDQAL